MTYFTVLVETNLKKKKLNGLRNSQDMQSCFYFNILLGRFKIKKTKQHSLITLPNKKTWRVTSIKTVSLD